nr:immunoglobulin light chain junction region [Macaca mulatta]MOW05090.1 immunoglobulin light chain junction region [Macaca mulatta]
DYYCLSYDTNLSVLF